MRKLYQEQKDQLVGFNTKLRVALKYRVKQAIIKRFSKTFTALMSPRNQNKD